MSNYSQLGLADKWRPLVPQGDDPGAATAVLNAVLERTGVWIDELRAITNEHFDAAPESSAHASAFSAVIARAFFDWVEEWPR
jgi:hypothetical protein